MNSVILIGRLTRDPEVRYTQDQMAIARFSLAIDRPVRSGGEKQTDYPNIVCFGKTAELVERYVTKGRQVAVNGRIQTGSYVNKDGNKVYTTEVVANNVEFLGSSRDQAAAPASGGYSQAPAAQQSSNSGLYDNNDAPAGFEALDDDIPF